MGSRLENSDVLIMTKLDRSERNAIDARKRLSMGSSVNEM